MVGKLESLIGFVIHVIFGFIYLAIFNIDVMQTYLAFSSLVLAFSFIFNQSLRQVRAYASGQGYVRGLVCWWWGLGTGVAGPQAGAPALARRSGCYAVQHRQAAVHLDS